VLGVLVVEHHMARIAGAGGHALCNPTVAVGRQVRSADSIDLLPLHAVDEIGQPVFISDAIRVGIGNDLALRGDQPGVSRNA
jgi:hypothetical protein